MEAAITAAATTISTGIEGIVTAVAPLAGIVVIGLAGFRALVKLFNRGVGK
jgi:hypothetical protein